MAKLNPTCPRNSITTNDQRRAIEEAVLQSQRDQMDDMKQVGTAVEDDRGDQRAGQGYFGPGAGGDRDPDSAHDEQPSGMPPGMQCTVDMSDDGNSWTIRITTPHGL